jgi:haloalkane dehalogenase
MPRETCTGFQSDRVRPFGRSDKPVERAAYTYESHIAWTGDWLNQLGLTDITLFCQERGGFIFNVHVGLTPDRFAAMVPANTGLAEES